MPDPIDLTLLRSFVAIADCGSILAAAPRVGRSQSAVSLQMQRLEADVGRILFHRDGRNLRLNAAGEELLLHARRLLQMSDTALASLREPEETGLVRIGLPEDYAATLPPVLARFAQAHPLAEIELVCAPTPPLMALIEAGSVDVAVVTRTGNQPFGLLRRERFVWAAAREHAAWLRDPLPVALFEPGNTARRHAVEALQKADRPYRVACSSASPLGLIAAARAGLAVAGLVASCVPPDLVVLGEAEGMPALRPFDLSLVMARGEPSRLANRLHAFLLRELSDGAEDAAEVAAEVIENGITARKR